MRSTRWSMPPMSRNHTVMLERPCMLTVIDEDRAVLQGGGPMPSRLEGDVLRIPLGREHFYFRVSSRREGHAGWQVQLECAGQRDDGDNVVFLTG